MNQQSSPETAHENDQPLVLERREDGIGILTLNRPQKRNIFSSEMLHAMREVLERFAADAAVRAIVIAANGAVFSAGHNMREFVDADPASAKQVFDLSSELMLMLQELPKPVIAQVEGLASAAGCQLVASCDLVVAATTARFQTPGVMIGLFCSTPMIPLSRAIPPKKAMEMLLTGEPIGAEEALQAGLVNRVVSPENLEAETLALARKIIQYSSATIALGKQAFYKQLPLDMAAAYEVGKEAITRNAMDPDGQEGMRAFLEKRPPKWKN